MSPAIQLPTEEYRKKLNTGKPLEFQAPPKDQDETPNQKAARTIPARWLELLAENHRRVISVPIQISNAIIEGHLHLEYAVFECNLVVKNCEFTGSVNFSFATFSRAARFTGSHFHGQAHFRGARANFDFEISETSFSEAARFQDLHCEEVLGAVAANFVFADFQRVEVAKDAVFRSISKGQHALFGGEARFDGAHIGGDADFSGAEFKGRANFYGFHVDGSAHFDPDDKGKHVVFGDEVHFNSAHIEGNASFKSAEFRAHAWFDAIQFDGPVFFWKDACGPDTRFTQFASFPSSVFKLDAQFTGVDFDGGADFENACFEGPASFDYSKFGQHTKTTFLGTHFARSASFEKCQFQNDVNFSTCNVDDHAQFASVTFTGKAEFDGIQIGGDAIFTDSAFISNVSFDGIHVGGGALFFSSRRGLPLKFGGKASFDGAHIEGNLQFEGSQFMSDAVFDGLWVGGDIYFTCAEEENQHVTFGGKASFDGAHIEGNAEFEDSRFMSDAVFNGFQVGGDALFFPKVTFCNDVSFNNAHFGRVNFSSARFQGQTDFIAAIAERDAYFFDAVFSQPVSFREARFHSVFFHELSKKTDKPGKHLLNEGHYPPRRTLWMNDVDLRGFTYERIYIHLPDLIPRIAPFDRQPYSQLEATLRKIGDDQRAREVYISRREAERKQKLQAGRHWAWILDGIYKVGANYGIRPIRLLYWALILILIGTLVFDRSGALETATKESSRATGSIQTKPCPDTSFRERLALSVHYFLPMEVPLGDDCKPAPGLSSWYATIFLRVTGAVLVGIGLAAITGLLRRLAH